MSKVVNGALMVQVKLILAKKTTKRWNFLQSMSCAGSPKSTNEGK
jgi:hypothetical protein